MTQAPDLEADNMPTIDAIAKEAATQPYIIPDNEENSTPIIIDPILKRLNIPAPEEPNVPMIPVL